MGTFNKGLTAAVLTLGLTGVANATNADQYHAADDSLASQVCLAAATATKIGMYVEARDFRPGSMPNANYKFIANYIQCNGQNIADFAKFAGNDVIANKLYSYQKNTVLIRDIAKASFGHVNIGSK